MGDDQTEYRYAGFFHFKTEDDIVPLVQWLKANSLEFAGACEKMDSSNLTDRHIQWCIRLDHQWSDKWTKQFEKKGLLGKHLVEDKRANTGCKHSKRWSKIDCVAKGYSWRSSLNYVGKDVTNPDQLWWGSPLEDDLGKDDIIGKFHYSATQKREHRAKKPKAFFQICCEAYEEIGCPNDKMRVMEMLIDNCCFGKWMYTPFDRRVTMVDAIILKYHKNTVKESMMARYQTYLCLTEGKSNASHQRINHSSSHLSSPPPDTQEQGATPDSPQRCEHTTVVSVDDTDQC